MKISFFSTVTNSVTVAVIFFLLLPFPAAALGSGSTYAVVYGSDTVCALISGQPTQRILCYDTRLRTTVTLSPGVSFSSIAAGDNFLCGIRSGGYSLLCWDNIGSYNLSPKRIYQNDTVLLNNLSIGDTQICATVNGTNTVKCWRTDQSPPPNESIRSISSGVGFSCGVTIRNNRILCWGKDQIKPVQIQTGFENRTMLTISVGESHACGLNTTGDLICVGDNESGQLNIPSNQTQRRYSQISLGSNFTCATLISNGSVTCWGGGRGGADKFNNVTESISFESITSGSGLICGLISSNLSVMCWSPLNSSRIFLLPFPEILPGPCVDSSLCSCGLYPQSDKLCAGSGSICSFCPITIPANPPPPPPQTQSPSDSSPPSKTLTRGLLAFAIVGSVGAFAGICSVVYCLWSGVCFGKKKVHNSVQPTITRGGGGSNSLSSSSPPPSRSLTIRRQGSRMLSMRRQRSGASSMKHGDKAEEFAFSELAFATGNFSLENKIGSGSFGVVYRGKLNDGREVAIKRGEVNAKMKKFQEKESAFDSEIAFLSRLHHKHLVRLVGYCEEREERLLVYDYMKNGALYDHLHDKNNVEKHSSLINSWKMRIKIALDAARGIEYLHNYAVPPIIHRDIKSSNILLDSNWVARVSDFGLSLMGPESGKDHHQHSTKAAGTVGYIDPEYYSLNVLTDKSDVYGLGVVLLELLTGKRAIFKNCRDVIEEECAPTHLVDFSVPAIRVDELGRILDPRVGSPELGEGDAVELVAYTAMHCVNPEGKNRPTMTDIVANLERALDLCGDSHGSISSGICSIVSD